VGGPLRRERQSALAVLGAVNLEPLIGKTPLEERREFRIVVDQKYACGQAGLLSRFQVWSG